MMTITQRHVSPRFLTRCYLAALAIIALLSIASHLVLSEALRADEGSAEIINASGRQRMLSQRIVSLSAELEAGDATARRPLVEGIAELGAAHRRLVALVPSTADSDHAKLKALYFGRPAIDRRVERFTAAAARIARRHSDASLSVARDRDFALIADEARGPLLVGLDQAVKVHQAASEARSRQLVTIQWWILAVVLLTLLVEAMFIFRPMVSRLADYVMALLRLADVDYLTGLANRRAFTDQSLRAIEQGRRHRRPATVLLIDVDHFKAVNDTHGHPGGDAALCLLSDLFRDGARAGDVVGRIGGEEFAIFLPETSGAQAAVIAERVRATVAATPVEIDGKTVPLTVSIGMANVRFDESDPLAAALKIADAMLYLAKKMGRNRVWPVLNLKQPAPRLRQKVA